MMLLRRACLRPGSRPNLIRLMRRFLRFTPFVASVILADEVGLGKTIEASLVIAQHWAERRRRILLVVPASLRKQWQQELREKFSLTSVILERKLFATPRRRAAPAA